MMSAEAGERLGRYLLLEPLGEGGMAKVFIAKKDGATSVCVLKQLHLQLEEQDEAIKRFTREAHIAAILDHPNIAGISDAGVEGDKFCIAMDFIEGQTVEALVKAQRRRGEVVPFDVTVSLMLNALTGLIYAHEVKDPETGRSMGLVHRDLSPRNIMLSYEGETKIIDFGIAKGEVDEYKTAIGSLMGTPYYMSPEQARAQSVDQRSDVYTMGAVLFEMLVGRRLVQAKGRAKILMTVAREPAPPPRTLNPAVPEAVEQVVLKALQKRPEDRWQSAREFHAALKEAGGRLGTANEDRLGRFVKTLFPEGQARAAELRSLGQSDGPGPAVEATRVAQTDESGELVMPSALSKPSSADRTRTGYAAPNMEAQDVGTVTRTGYVGQPDPATGTAAPMPVVPGVDGVPHVGTFAPQDPASSTGMPAHFNTQTFADLSEGSRSQLTAGTRTSAVQKLGVGFTLLLLCIVGYVAYGHLSAPVEVDNRTVAATTKQPEAKVTVAAAPKRVTVEPNERRTPPPPPPPRRTTTTKRRTSPPPPTTAPPPPAKAPPPPPPAPSAGSKFKRRLAALKQAPDKRKAAALARTRCKRRSTICQAANRNAAHRWHSIASA